MATHKNVFVEFVIQVTGVVGESQHGPSHNSNNGERSYLPEFRSIRHQFLKVSQPCVNMPISMN